MRALLFFLLILVVFLLVSRLFSKKPSDNNTANHDTKHDPKPMVACDYCGVHLPKEEAIQDEQDSGRYYCSKSHLDLANNS